MVSVNLLIFTTDKKESSNLKESFSCKGIDLLTWNEMKNDFIIETNLEYIRPSYT